jgi:hypothetical protein
MDSDDSSEESEEYSESEEESYYEEYEEYSESAESYEEWSADVQLSTVTSSSYGYSFDLPAGGRAEAQSLLSIGSFSYPFIWVSTGGPLLFDRVEVGVIDNHGKIDGKAFRKLGDQEAQGLRKKFPKLDVRPEPHQLGSHKWHYSSYLSNDVQRELSKFSTHVGSSYYSLYFYMPASADHDESWNQMAAVVSSFDLK